MTKEELMALAAEVTGGKASPEETKVFFAEFKESVADLNRYLSSLPKKILQND